MGQLRSGLSDGRGKVFSFFYFSTRKTRFFVLLDLDPATQRPPPPPLNKLPPPLTAPSLLLSSPLSIDISSTCIRLSRQYKLTFGEEGGDSGRGHSGNGRQGAVPIVLAALFSTVTCLTYFGYLIITFALERGCRSAQRAVVENPPLAPGSVATAAAADADARTEAVLADSCSRGSEAAKWGLFVAFMLGNVALCVAGFYMHRRRARRQQQQQRREGLRVAGAATTSTAEVTSPVADLETGKAAV